MSIKRKIASLLLALSLAVSSAVTSAAYDTENVSGGSQSEVSEDEAELYGLLPVDERELSDHKPVGGDETVEIALSDAEAAEIDEIIENDYEEYYLSEEYQNEEPQENAALYNFSTDYYYNQMSSAEKTFYNKLKTACNDFLQSSISLSSEYISSVSYSGLTKTQAVHVYYLFYYSNPQYYFLVNGYAANSTSLYILTLDKFMSASTRASYQSSINSLTNQWMSEINAVSEPLDKERIIYENIAKHVDYVKVSGYDQNICGSLVDRKAVCAGYAAAVAYFCNAAGIDCVEIKSDGHRWNAVNLYGNWYILDVTWMDDGSTVSYDWCNISDKRSALQDSSDAHTYTQSVYLDVTPPKCNYPYVISDTYDYTKGLVISNGIVTGYTGTNTFARIPYGVTAIAKDAFEYNRSLYTVEIPESVTSIGESAFYCCYNLGALQLPSGLTAIDRYTFGWTDIRDIFIPDSVRSIGYAAFNGANCLTDIYYSGSSSAWSSIQKGSGNSPLDSCTIHYNSSYPGASYGFTVSAIADLTYTGYAVTPALTVKSGTKTLTQGTHYTAAYSNNTNAGTASVTVTGKGSYTGTKTATFRILPKNISYVTAAAIADQTYTGYAITPAVTLSDGTRTLTKGTDYTASYSNNTNVGTATVTIKGSGNYTGTRNITFRIAGKSASGFTVTAIADQTYTGSAITPPVTVKDGTKTLAKGTDYTVSYSNNINAGTAAVTITGINNSTGTKTATFRILPKNISGVSVTAIADQDYTGSSVTPALTVKDGTKTLTKGTDLIVSYSNNINVGTASAVITGKGNYTGTRTLSFRIVKSYPAVKAVGGDRQITLTWDKVSGASKYGVYRYEGGKFTRIDLDVTGTSYIVTGLSEDTEYTFFVQAYKNNKWCAGTDASYATARTNEGITYTTVTAKGGDKQISLTWTKVNGAVKYGVYRYAGGKYTKVNTEVTGTGYTVTGLAEDTEYTFFVQVYKNNKWYSGSGASYATARTNEGAVYTTVTAKGGDKQISLTWTKVNGASKYGIYRYADGKYTKVNLEVTGTSYTVTGLAEDTEYTFFVQVYKNNKWYAGIGASYATARTNEGIGYTTVTAKGGDKQISLTWTKVNGAAKYGVYRYADGKYTKVSTEVTGTSYTVTGLAEDTEYTFFVQAYKNNKWCAGADASYATARTNEGIGYTTVTAKGGDKQISLTGERSDKVRRLQILGRQVHKGGS